MRRTATVLAVLLLIGLMGCGEQRTFNLRGRTDPIIFPNGAIFNTASGDQAGSLAEIMVESHNMQMQEMEEMREENRQTAQQALRLLEELSKNQGAGEITLFFPTGSAALGRNSMEYQRLVRFVDYISRESRGRLVHFVMIGSASTTGSQRANERLSMRRANVPVDVIDKYLVNVPHQYYKINGVGDMYSPENVSWKVHQRYQNVRIIAAFGEEDFGKYGDRL